MCLLSPLDARVFPDVNRCRPRVCWHSLCELTCASVLLCVEDTSALVLSILFGSYSHSDYSPHRSLSPEGRGDDIIPCMTGSSKVSHPTYCPVVGLCATSHLLQEEASLIMADRGTNVRRSRMLLGVILLLYSLSRTYYLIFP